MKQSSEVSRSCIASPTHRLLYDLISFLVTLCDVSACCPGRSRFGAAYLGTEGPEWWMSSSGKGSRRPTLFGSHEASGVPSRVTLVDQGEQYPRLLFLRDVPKIL